MSYGPKAGDWLQNTEMCIADLEVFCNVFSCAGGSVQEAELCQFPTVVPSPPSCSGQGNCSLSMATVPPPSTSGTGPFPSLLPYNHFGASFSLAYGLLPQATFPLYNSGLPRSLPAHPTLLRDLSSQTWELLGLDSSHASLLTCKQ